MNVSELSAQQLKKTATRYSWYIVGVLTFTNMISAIDRFMMSIVIVPLKADMHLTDTQLGMVQGLGFAVLYCIAGVPSGRLADIVSRRLMIFWGCLAWTLATAACAFAHSFGTLFAARVAVGLGEATLLPAAISLIAAYVGRENLGLATGIYMMGATVGKAISFVGGGLLLSMLAVSGGLIIAGRHFNDWQSLFVLTAIPGILAALTILSIREPERHRRSTVREGTAEIIHFISLQRKAYGSFVVQGICCILMAHVFASWAPSFFVRQYGLDIGHAALAVGLVVISVGPLGGIFGGLLADWLTRRGVKRASVVVIFISILLTIPATFLLVFGKSLTLSLVGYGLSQAAILMGGPQSYTGMQILTPKHHRGLVAAIFLTVSTFVAVGLGPVLIGLFSDHLFQNTGNSLGYSILSAILVFGAIGSIAAIPAGRNFEATAEAALA